MADGPLTSCGSCGGTLRKVFHPAGIMFKGSGFYATDSRKKSTPAAAKDLKDMSTADIKAEGAKAAGKDAGKTGDTAPAKNDGAGAGKEKPSSGGGAKASRNASTDPSKKKEKSA